MDRCQLWGYAIAGVETMDVCNAEQDPGLTNNQQEGAQE
jgi:hypothetical protein